MPKREKSRFSVTIGEPAEDAGFVCETCVKMFREDEAKEQGMRCCGRAMKELDPEDIDP